MLHPHSDRTSIPGICHEITNTAKNEHVRYVGLTYQLFMYIRLGHSKR